LAWAGILAHADNVNGLSLILPLGAAAAGVGVTRLPAQRSQRISATFLVYMLAATFLGPASGFLAGAIGQLVTDHILPTRWQARLFNLLGNGAPPLVVGTVMRHFAPHNHHALLFYAWLAVVAFGALTLSWFIIAPLFRMLDGDRETWSLRAWSGLMPTILLNVGMVVAGAAIYIKVGLAGIAFALLAVAGFSYQSRLVAKARHRSQQYVSLSWGVLAGLMRSLDIRDGRAARHAAAVARFSRDIAKAVGMDEHQQELAHTAALLHDIGHFALSDRVAEHGRALTEEDWITIQRHPELGADMLKDLGMYGPVGDIVLAHHERIDGRGYPRGLKAEEIPEIAKIIAVAEAYDTLTAGDTYRTRVSSFEALRELRRVSGSQLDGRYVEVLASLLSGEGVEYRHADAADFDTELDMERRIREAGAGG
jgi:putative nucleotidyltransferase with HDIG domain